MVTEVVRTILAHVKRICIRRIVSPLGVLKILGNAHTPLNPHNPETP